MPNQGDEPELRSEADSNAVVANARDDDDASLGNVSTCDGPESGGEGARSRQQGGQATGKKGKRAKEDRQTRWKRVMQHGVREFMAEKPEIFQRRVRRGIPKEYRWEVWKAAMRSEERAELGVYQKLLAAENPWKRPIEIDIPRTFPEIPLFDKEQQQSLLRILQAYAILDPDVGYCQGMNFVAGFLMLVCQREDFRQTPRLEKEEETFWMFVSLMESGRLSGFYKRRFPLLRRFCWAFDELVAEALPDLREHFNRENVQHAVYLHQWFLTLFINCLPLPMVLQFWDVIVCSGLDALLPVTVSLLRVLKDVLLSMQFEDIVRFFKMLRMGDLVPDCNFASVGQMVVAQSGAIDVPARIAERLKATEAHVGDGDSPAEHRESRGSEDLDETPQNGSGPPWDFGNANAASGEARAVDPGNAGASFQFGSYLSRHIGDISREWPQGVLSWWEDARDNLHRVGLGVPVSRDGARPSAASNKPAAGHGDALSGSVGSQGRTLNFTQRV